MPGAGASFAGSRTRARRMTAPCPARESGENRRCRCRPLRRQRDRTWPVACGIWRAAGLCSCWWAAKASNLDCLIVCSRSPRDAHRWHRGPVHHAKCDRPDFRRMVDRLAHQIDIRPHDVRRGRNPRASAPLSAAGVKSHIRGVTLMSRREPPPASSWRRAGRAAPRCSPRHSPVPPAHT